MRLCAHLIRKQRNSGYKQPFVLPFTFRGNRLRINAAARGSLRAALLDESGKPLPGFDLADCRPVSGDSVSEELQWKADLGAMEGKPVRLRFEIRDASLFAFQFSR